MLKVLFVFQVLILAYFTEENKSLFEKNWKKHPEEAGFALKILVSFYNYFQKERQDYPSLFSRSAQILGRGIFLFHYKVKFRNTESQRVCCFWLLPWGRSKLLFLLLSSSDASFWKYVVSALYNAQKRLFRSWWLRSCRTHFQGLLSFSSHISPYMCMSYVPEKDRFLDFS